ncbi:MAG: hypothetical protein IIB35_05095 [Gemmatimonadetes bacterium]|nr:hypothetical protein [Gemmatimonadota bacterium]
MTRDFRFRAVLAACLLLVGGATTASSQRIVNIFDAVLVKQIEADPAPWRLACPTA